MVWKVALKCAVQNPSNRHGIVSDPFIDADGCGPHAKGVANSRTNIMLSGYKTYIAGGLTILGALGGFLSGNLAPADALNLLIPAILAMTVRHGVATTAAAA